MMWLLTLWGGVKRLFGLVAQYPWQAALVAALLACGFFYGAWQGAVDTIAKRDATIAAMIKASKEATAAQIAMNKAVTDKQADIARKADANETNRRDIADRSSDYASRMRAETYCRKADTPAESSDTESGNRPGADAVMVSRADFDVLTANTARLLDVKAWGDELIAEGLAVPVE